MAISKEYFVNSSEKPKGVWDNWKWFQEEYFEVDKTYFFDNIKW